MSKVECKHEWVRCGGSECETCINKKHKDLLCVENDGMEFCRHCGILRSESEKAVERKERFTPGPWESCDDGNYGTSVYSKDGMCICALFQPTNSTDDVEANGRLIAAAPEMYGLIKRFIEIVDTENSDEDITLCKEGEELYDKLKAVLRKARGGQ